MHIEQLNWDQVLRLSGLAGAAFGFLCVWGLWGCRLCGFNGLKIQSLGLYGFRYLRLLPGSCSLIPETLKTTSNRIMGPSSPNPYTDTQAPMLNSLNCGLGFGYPKTAQP